MCQVGPAGSIFFYQCTGLVISESQPGIPANVSIIAVLILDTCRPAFPCLSHGFQVPFSKRPRRARSIGFRASGRSHNRPSLFGDLEHKKAVERPIPIAAQIVLSVIDYNFMGSQERL